MGEMNLLKRYDKNPILKPIKENNWESIMVYNCAAIYLDNKVHIIYRARGVDGGVSRFGYASSKDGFNIDKRFAEPIFVGCPYNDYECLGVEDPRITKIGDRLYMCYSAYGKVPGITRNVGLVQLGITNIKVADFLSYKWNWNQSIYPFPNVDNKNAFIFPEKIRGKWVMYIRIPPHIWVTYSDDLIHWSNCSIVMSPKEDWEYFKLGAGAPAIKTEEGWLFIYHAVSRDFCYRLGLALIDLENPEKIIWRSKIPLLEPKEPYETEGIVSNVVFSCGAVVIKDTLFVYYGGADTVICVATSKLQDILDYIKKNM